MVYISIAKSLNEYQAPFINKDFNKNSFDMVVISWWLVVMDGRQNVLINKATIFSFHVVKAIF